MNRFLAVVIAATAMLVICNMTKANSRNEHPVDQRPIDRDRESSRPLVSRSADFDWAGARRLSLWRFNIDQDDFRRLSPWWFKDLWDDLRYFNDWQDDHCGFRLDHR